MKKTLRIFGMMLSIILIAVGLNACGSDDEDDRNPSIVGTWYLESTYFSGTDFEYSVYAEIKYKKDGTLTGYWKKTYKDGKEEIETDTGRYEVIKDVLRVWWFSEADEDYEPWTATFSINGNKMTTSENDGTVWTRK
ncbi:MAG: hypothetical protein K2L17_04990 [Muribaculaceae bacterium]|nr:hypothetical protein [Muribaculaceae bacterium]MDE6786905.1 hypothetical protein [Muribaculaceae bacterium]